MAHSGGVNTAQVPTSSTEHKTRALLCRKQTLQPPEIEVVTGRSSSQWRVIFFLGMCAWTAVLAVEDCLSRPKVVVAGTASGVEVHRCLHSMGRFSKYVQWNSDVPSIRG